MRVALRLLRPAANQNVASPKLWQVSIQLRNVLVYLFFQDPVMGYFETHGKTEFTAGEQYGLTEEQKKVN